MTKQEAQQKALEDYKAAKTTTETSRVTTTDLKGKLEQANIEYEDNALILQGEYAKCKALGVELTGKE